MVNPMLGPVVDPLMRVWDNILLYLPKILGALVILVLGYVIALIVSKVVYKLIEKAQLQTWLVEKTKVKNLFGTLDLAELFGLLTKWFLFILFLPAAADIMNLGGFSNLLANIAIWVPKLILSALIGLAGYALGAYVAAQIVSTKAKGAKLVSEIVKVVIWVLALVIALQQISVVVSMAENTVLILVGGLVFAVSLALGIGFGLALKDEASKQLKNLKKWY